MQYANILTSVTTVKDSKNMNNSRDKLNYTNENACLNRSILNWNRKGSEGVAKSIS